MLPISVSDNENSVIVRGGRSIRMAQLKKLMTPRSQLRHVPNEEEQLSSSSSPLLGVR